MPNNLQPRIPFAPLVNYCRLKYLDDSEAIKFYGEVVLTDDEKVLYPRGRHHWSVLETITGAHRSTLMQCAKKNEIGLYLADKICQKGLSIHPVYIWPDWYSFDIDVLELVPRRTRAQWKKHKDCHDLREYILEQLALTG